MNDILKIKNLISKKNQITDLSNRLIKSASWALIGSIAGRGISMISYIWAARILSQNVYGEFGILRSTINMFTVFAGMGLGATAAKYISQYRNTNPIKAGNIYTLSNILIYVIAIAFTLFIYFSAPFIADYSLHAKHLVDEIQIGSIILFFIAVNSVQNGALSGFEDFKSIAINTFISGCIQAFCLIIGCYTYGISGMLIGWGIGCLSCYVLNRRSINIHLIKNNIKSNIKNIHRSDLNILLRFSFPTLLASVMVGPVLWWTKTYLISKSSYNEVAIFDVAEQWYTMVLFIPTALGQIILPMLTNTMEEGTSKQYVKLVKTNLVINVSIALLLSILMILLGPVILGFYGEGFVDIKALAFMMLATIASSACNVVGQVIASRDKMWYGFSFNILWASLLILYTIIFVGNYNLGASGLALAMLLAYISHFALQAIYIWKVIY